MFLRIKNIQKKIELEKLDGLISFNPSNIFYLTGFRAESSFIFVSRKETILLVPELLYSSAKKLARCKVEIIRSFKDSFQKYKNKKIGFESSISYWYLKELEKIPNIKLKICIDFIENMRLVKDNPEISKIKTACKISKKAFESVKKKINCGMSEKELADELEYHLRKNGAEKSSFDIIVASGPNSVNCHHKPTNRRFHKDEIVLIDFGCIYDDYNSDLTKTVFLGKINKYQQKVFEIVKEAQQKAINVIADGVSCRKVDFEARNFIDKNGFNKYFIHSTGHGLGIDVHEKPALSSKSDMILKAGMVVTVEPGIYIPGKFGVRIEDMVLVTKNGCEVL
ncbi:MAG: Xaa-Pro peptidase family protein [Elusimicrobia bacterium]|nr:Xaa-Pro peptidase family protein [Elusimicrobiota bacterium]